MSRSRLVGRVDEAGRLQQALRSAQRRRGGLVLVAGDAGIGKTELIESIVSRSAAIVLRGAARSEATPPLGPLIAAIRSHPDWPGIAEALDRSGRVQLRDLIPEAAPSDMSGTESHPAGGRPPNEIASVCRLLIAMSRVDPLTLVLDDLQWVDHASVELLMTLAGAIEHEHVLVIGAYRTDELVRSSPIRRLRVGLRRIGRFTEINLSGLDGDQIVELSSDLLGASPDRLLAQRLIDQSQGVPLYVEELVGALRTTGAVTLVDGVATLARDDLPIPDSLRDSVLVRIDGLASRTREALGVAALIGEHAPESLVDDLVPGAGDWPRAGRETGILRGAVGNQIAFRHSLVREILADDLPSPERRTYHRRLASILAERAGDPLEIAAHWLATDEPSRAVAWLVEAGDGSCRVHAYRDAATAFRRALDEDRGTLPDRVTILERLAECSELAGEPAEAARTWLAAATMRQAAGEHAESAQDQRRRARALEVQGRWQRATDARLAAADQFAVSGAAADAAIERLAVASHLRSAASFTAALEVLALARHDATAADRIDLEIRVAGQEGNVLARLGQTEVGLALLRDGLARALDHGATEAAAELYQRLADALEHDGQRVSARDAYTEGAAFCRAKAIEDTALLCMACMSVVLWQTGDWPAAERVCREVVASTDATLHARAVAEGVLGLVSAVRGRPGRARPHLEACLAIGRRIELVAMELLATWGLAITDRIEGDDAAAEERCRDLLVLWDQTEERHFVVPALRWAAGFHAQRRDPASVRACASALSRIAAQTGQREAVASLGFALGEAAAVEGNHAGAVTHLARALQAISDDDLPLERAEIGRRYGLELVAVGERDEGLRTLAIAARTARRIGAAPLAETIAADVERLGESIERRLGRREARRLADGGLTQREIETLRLVAGGMTSREIGEALFISTRTVEMHVGSALTKLDCRTRAEAVQRVGSLGLLA